MRGISITSCLVILIAKAWASPQFAGRPTPLYDVRPPVTRPQLPFHPRFDADTAPQCGSPDSASRRDRPCAGQFELIGDNCYFLSWNHGAEKLHWQEARNICQAKGNGIGVFTDLAEFGGRPSSFSDCLIMIQITELGKGNGVWLGATDKKKDNDWRWVHSGNQLSLDNPYWGINEPNDIQNETCLCGWHYGKKYSRSGLNDAACNGHKFDYICQIYNN